MKDLPVSGGLRVFMHYQSHPVQIFSCASNTQFTLARVLESRTDVSGALCREAVVSGEQNTALHAVVSWGSFRCYTVFTPGPETFSDE